MDRFEGNSLWDEIAEDFGKIGPNYWNEFGERLIKLSNINKGARVLDIGMGRGASLFPAINKVGSKGFVLGIDNSKGMVRETDKELMSKNITNCAVKVMNGENLMFEDNSFDDVACGFGLGFLLLKDKKLNEVMRVLKIGGQVAFSVWGEQLDQRWLTNIVDKYLKSNEQDISKENTRTVKLDNVQVVTEVLSSCGFKNIKAFEENNEVMYKSKNEWWQEMNVNAVKGIFKQIAEQGSIQYKEFKKDIYVGLEKFQRKEGLLFNMPVIYVYGEK